MAHIRKVPNGYRVEVARNGVRKSRTFETKSAATQWGAAEETEILSVKRGALPKKTFADALIRYRDEISPTKKGGSWEVKRINAFLRNYPATSARIISQLDSADMTAWRDDRLKKVTRGSVQRDTNLLSHVFTVARTAWKWCKESPLVGVDAPGDNPSRVRLPQMSEVRRILRWLGYKTGATPQTKQAEVALAYLISLRTAMRSGEILSLTRKRIDVAGRFASVPHKTQRLTGRPREVPLSRHGLRVLAPLLHGFRWTVSDGSRDALFRKATRSLLIPDLTFHDARADALTRFARKVDVMQLAKISGHKDLRILLETYYRVTPAEIAANLDSPKRGPLLRPTSGTSG